MMGISHIIMSLFYKKGPCISSVDMFVCTLNISVEKLVNFLFVWWQIHLLLINPQKDDVLSVIIYNLKDHYSSNDYGTSIQVDSS